MNNEGGEKKNRKESEREKKHGGCDLILKNFTDMFRLTQNYTYTHPSFILYNIYP